MYIYVCRLLLDDLMFPVLEPLHQIEEVKKFIITPGPLNMTANVVKNEYMTVIYSLKGQ